MTNYPLPLPTDTSVGGNSFPLGNSGGTAFDLPVFDFPSLENELTPQEQVQQLLRSYQSSGIEITQEILDIVRNGIREGIPLWKIDRAVMQSETVIQKTEGSYIAGLQELGIAGGPGVDALIRSAVQNGWDQATFMYNLRKTPEYMARFPGIFDSNGQMRMTESQYLATESQFKNIAQQYGYNINSNEIGHAIAAGKQPELVAQQFEIRRRAQDYAPAMKQFGQVLKARGISQTANLTDKQVREFIGGIGPKEWYKVYEETSARTAAVQAGLTVGGDLSQYANISRKDILNLMNRIPGQQTEAELTPTLSKAADMYLETLPESAKRGLGLGPNPKDAILRAISGGKNSAQIRQKIDLIEKNATAAQENQAAVQFGGSQQGNYVIGGTDQRAQTGE